ncbi:hypothetical protein D3Z48_16845 [Clostridiaceae bacterium]|nr:hypothetical protein [Clostridiaceae bacterium]
MAVKAIAHSYWRRVRDGAREFQSVPAAVRDDVRTLAREDVQAGRLSPERFEQLTGEIYEETEAV